MTTASRTSLLALSLLFLLAPAARACPVCKSATAHEVRSSLADDLTPKTLAAIVTPFAVIAAVVSVIHFGAPGGRRKP